METPLFVCAECGARLPDPVTSDVCAGCQAKFQATLLPVWESPAAFPLDAPWLYPGGLVIRAACQGA
jgi:hypothetical protein